MGLAKEKYFYLNRDEVEKRSLERIQVRPGEGIHADLIIPTESGPKIHPSVRVYDLSASGISLIVPVEIVQNIEVDGQVTIKLHIGKEQSYHMDCVICSLFPYKEKETRIGLRCLVNQTEQNFIDKLNMFGEFPLMGFVYKPHFYYEKALLRIINLSRDKVTGMVQDSGLILCPGMDLNIHLFLPVEGQKEFCLKVNKVLSVDQGIITVEFNVVQMGKHAEEAMTHYMLQYTFYTPEQVRALGFSLKKISNELKVRNITTKEQYQAVLELRKKAYLHSQKIQEQVKTGEMVTTTDPYSRILGFYHHGNLVGCVALAFADDQSTILDTERVLSQGFDKGFPSKENIMEVARLCIDPDYRGGDMVFRMFEHIYRIFAMSGRHYVISSADPQMYKLYKKIGFRKTGMSYSHPDFGTHHDIIILEKETPLLCKKVSFFVWYAIYKDMTDFLISRGSFNPSFRQRLRIEFLKSLGNFIFSSFDRLKKAFKLPF